MRSLGSHINSWPGTRMTPDHRIPHKLTSYCLFDLSFWCTFLYHGRSSPRYDFGILFGTMMVQICDDG